MEEDELLHPIPAVDIIIRYKGGVVLVERKSGTLALPGGLMERGETAEEAAAREAEEETGLDLEDIALFNVYSDPDRDPRGHIISITFTAQGEGELEAGDDAVSVTATPIEDALEEELAFDHSKILAEYVERKADL